MKLSPTCGQQHFIMHLQYARATVCAVVTICTLIFFFWTRHNETQLALKFQCLQKSDTKAEISRVWFSSIYGNETLYEPSNRNHANANSMLSAGLQAANCQPPEPNMLLWLPPSMCQCLVEFHNGVFHSAFLNLTERPSDTEDERRALADDMSNRLLKECFFRSRAQRTVKPTDALEISPMCNILIVVWIITFCSLADLYPEKGENKYISGIAYLLGFVMYVFVIVGCFLQDPDMGGIAILLGVVLWFPDLCFWLFALLRRCNFPMADTYWKQPWKLPGLECCKHLCLEYCFTLVLLVTLYDATQQHRDHLYAVSRILYALGMSLFAIFASWKFGTEPNKAHYDLKAAWLLGSVFMACNTPPSSFTRHVLDATHYWTHVYIPSAFYLYTLGMPISICMSAMPVDGKGGNMMGMGVSTLTSMLLMAALASAHYSVI